MDKIKEIRAILSGRTYFQNGAYVAADRLIRMNFQGVNSGSFAVSFFGVNHLIRHYETKDPTAVVERAMRIFKTLGRPVLFTQSPEEKACLVRPPFGNPSIMILEQTDKGFLLNVYTARTLLAVLSRSRAVAAFEKRLPQELRSNMEATNEAVSKEERKNRKARRAQRKAAKWEKKATKAEKRTRRMKAQAQSAKQNAATEDSPENDK